MAMVGLHSCNPIMWKKLSRFGFSDCQPDSTPYGPSMLLRKNQRITRDQLRYSKIIGLLM